MSNAEHIYTQPGQHLSQDQLLRYHEGELTAAEMRRVEQHLLSCSLCSEALEGIALLDQPAFNTSMQDLQQRLDAKVHKDKPVTVPMWQWGVAASVLLAISVAIYFFISISVEPNQQLVRQNEVDSINVPLTQPDPIALQTPVTEEEAVTDGSFLAEAQQEAPLQKESSNRPLRQAPIATPALVEEVEAEAILEMKVEVPASTSADAIVFMDEVRLDTLKRSHLAVTKPEAAALQPPLQGKAAGVATGKVRSLAATSAFSAKKQVQGVVYSAGDGTPMPGVNVHIKGTAIGTITDAQGRYELTVPANAVLVFAFIGTVTQEVKVHDSLLAYNVSLADDVKSLSEVVVTAYGTRNRNGSSVSDAPVITTPRPEQGMRQFKRYIQENTRLSPEAQDKKISGNVRVSFFVNPDGSLSEFYIVRSMGYGLDDEAIRLIKEGPAWKPGTRNGAPERQKVSVKIPFKSK